MKQKLLIQHYLLKLISPEDSTISEVRGTTFFPDGRLPVPGNLLKSAFWIAASIAISFLFSCLT